LLVASLMRGMPAFVGTPCESQKSPRSNPAATVRASRHAGLSSKPENADNGHQHNYRDADDGVAASRPFLQVCFLNKSLVGPRDEVLLVDQSAKDPGHERLLVGGILADAAQIAAAQEGRTMLVAEQSACEDAAES